MASDAEHFFHMSMGPLYVLLGEVSIQVLCPFFIWVVCLPGVQLCFSLCGIYIFWKLTHYQMYHWQICSPLQAVLISFDDGFFSHAEAF